MKKNILKNQAGTAMTEVACVTALIVVAGIVSLGFMGGSLSQTFTDTGDKLNTSPAGGPGLPNVTGNPPAQGGGNAGVRGELPGGGGHSIGNRPPQGRE